MILSFGVLFLSSFKKENTGRNNLRLFALFAWARHEKKKFHIQLGKKRGGTKWQKTRGKFEEIRFHDDGKRSNSRMTMLDSFVVHPPLLLLTCLLRISGARYSGVPQNEWAPDVVLEIPSLDRPKSVNRMCPDMT